MSSRLDELRRHRALLQEHLAWLDREIAAAAGEKPASPAVPIVAAPRPATPPPAAPDAADAVELEHLFAELSAEEQKQMAPPSKTGCWVIYSAILLVLCATVGLLVHFFYRY